MRLYTQLVRSRKPGKPVNLSEREIKYLCTKSREIFLHQPTLLELRAPIKLCGTSPLYKVVCSATRD